MLKLMYGSSFLFNYCQGNKICDVSSELHLKFEYNSDDAASLINPDDGSMKKINQNIEHSQNIQFKI